jgi:hypothetical protein
MAQPDVGELGMLEQRNPLGFLGAARAFARRALAARRR